MPDVMFLNGIPFLITISCGIEFKAVMPIPTRMDNQLSKSIKKVMKIYSKSGMIVHIVLMFM